MAKFEVQNKKEEWKCGACDNVTTKLDMIMCDTCDLWFHCMVSTGMDDCVDKVWLNWTYSPLQVMCKLDIQTSGKLVLPVLHTFIEETVTILIWLIDLID